LTEGIHDHRLIELLRAPESAGGKDNPALHLVEESLKNDGRDNTTALVVRVV
jgi:hypothetical protein